MVFQSGLLLYRVRAFKCYLDVCLLEKVGDFPNYGAVVGENGPFSFLSILSLWVLY
jgi:hypothetical protein